MKAFKDEQGRGWIADVAGGYTLDYKGRYYFVMRPEGGGEEDTVALDDIRWNTEKTARRTLATMSDVELRRRLRSAVGRSRPAPLPDPAGD
jgi:hypothetical protein